MRLEQNQMEDLIPLLREHQEKGSKGTFSERKVRFLLANAIDDPKTLILVNKKVTAVLVFQVIDSPFTSQPSVQEICFYSKTPGSGFRLLKESIPWIQAWGDSLLYKTFVSTGSVRTNKMLERLGMKQMGVVYSMEDIL